MDQQTTQVSVQNNSAKFAFFYMLSLVALIFMALSTGMIIFQIINKTIVDIALSFPGGFDSGAMKFAIAAVIITTPIYYLMMWQINKNLISGELNKDAGVRKWLTYLILFITSVVMIGWLIATILSFLDGELTTKFILKAITAIVISASIFSYYFYDIKRENVLAKDKVTNLFFYVSLGVVLASLVASFFFVESPKETRARKQDNAVLEQFSVIDNALNAYYYDNGRLPASLEELVKSKGVYPLSEDNIQDPATKEKFKYSVKEKNLYELCATFQTSNKDKTDMAAYYYFDRWPHDAGVQCLSQKVRSDIRDVKAAPITPEPVK